MKSKILERDIQKSIIEYLQRLGWYVLRINSGMIPLKSGNKTRMYRGAPAGTPDLIACDTKGRFWGIELKKPKKKPTDLQWETLNQIDKCNGIACVVHSLEEMKELILKI